MLTMRDRQVPLPQMLLNLEISDEAPGAGAVEQYNRLGPL
jgi:hypothetical protein